MTILVTGSTGHLGHLVIDELIARGVDPSSIRAGARTPAKADDLAALGVHVVHLDYTDGASIQAAIDGVDSVLLVSGSEVGSRVAQHQAVIDAAVAAGVERFVYTSAPQARTSELILAPEHKATEEAIEAAGLPATILRNGWYTENFAAALDEAAATGSITSSAGDGRTASASRADYAAAAAVVLTEPGHIGHVYELSGDVAWTHDELAAAASDVLGRPVSYRNLTPEEHLEHLTAVGLDVGTAGFVVALAANTRDGLLAETSGDLARLIGRPTTPLREGLAALAAAK